MKKCFKCMVLKEFSEFHKNKRSPDGYKARCKACRNIENKEHREQNPDYYKKWRNDNKDKMKDYSAQYRKANEEQLKTKKLEYIKQNEELVKARKKAWYERNKERIIKNKKERRQANIQLRLSENLRSRLYRAIRRNTKNGSAVGDLGCSIEEFKQYIENKFELGMSWDNYGKWHLDHYIPLSSFDLTDREQVKKACHHTNLQPLWAEDNLRKGAKLPK